MPDVSVYRERVQFVGKNERCNISILLWNITFEDGGEYICFGRNPKEKYKNHSASINLIVVDECELSQKTFFSSLHAHITTQSLPESEEINTCVLVVC